MPKNSEIQDRKSEHLTINTVKDVQSGLQNGLEHFHFIHNALPEISLSEIDTRITFFRKELSFPLLISSMTGGTSQAEQLNQRLAEAAQHFRIGMGVGSQRIGLEHPELMNTFKVRKVAPDILLFANIGAIQLNYGYTIEHCKAAVDALEADALILHLNPLQEALMENGNTNFKGILKCIELVCRGLPVPVIVKEVGWGINPKVARQLVEAGVQAIDVSGAGGTSWSEVEKHRAKNDQLAEVASAFKDWGIPTALCLQEIHEGLPEIPLIASGGMHDGVEVAKCLALGANLVGMAGPLLRATMESEGTLHQKIEVVSKQLRLSMFTTGSKTLAELQLNKLISG
jgi:isopentenyl-diphosphate Delta-isomerase